MDYVARVAFITIVSGLAGLGCGSGGPDGASSSGASGSSTSSSGSSGSSGGSSGSSGSSGSAQCEGTCMSGARITFDEANTDGRLEGALVEACRGARCSTGRLLKNDAGTSYQLSLTSTSDAGAAAVWANVQTAGDAGALRFEMTWSLDRSGPNGPVEGETFSVSARVSEDGAELFTRAFTAAYEDVSVCDTQCKVYRTGP